MEQHIEHAIGFAEAVGDVPPGRGLDLGSGGGVPGLVLALHWPASRWVLLDAQERRVTFLRAAIERLAVGSRVTAVHRRAEDAGHDDGLRGSFDLVTARSFGPPPVVAECGAPLLRVGGALVVSEPPGSGGERWSSEGLAMLGQDLAHVVGQTARYAVIRQVAPCPARFPRRAGKPRREPLF